jgi:hypothetical protein
LLKNKFIGNHIIGVSKVRSEAAAAWIANNRDVDMCLRGNALEEAEGWRMNAPADAEIPSDTLTFIAASADSEARRKAEAEAQLAERQRALAEREEALLAQKAAVAEKIEAEKALKDTEITAARDREQAAKRVAARTRIGAIVALVLAIAAGCFGIYARIQANEARLQEQIANREQAKAEEERKNARDQLAKNYWSNALNSKAKKDWLSLLHYAARVGEVATKKSFIKNNRYEIKNHINFTLNAIMEHEGPIYSAVFNREDTWHLDQPFYSQRDQRIADQSVQLLQHGKSFAVTGPSGAGKSTLVQHLLANLDNNYYHGLHVHYGGLQRTALLKTVGEQLGVETNTRAVPLLVKLQKHIGMMATGKHPVHPVILIDDAQLLERESLMDPCLSGCCTQTYLTHCFFV